MGERGELKDGLKARFAFLKSDLGFRGPASTDHSLLLTLLYRADAFNLKIVAELRDWYLDFYLLPPGRQGARHGFHLRITSHELFKSHFTQAEQALFDKTLKATAPRQTWGSVSAMLAAASHMAMLLTSLLPRLLERPERLFKPAAPDPT